ncbi:MAG TPA: hypothetical protein VHS28_02260 [Chloroflexota bacterium]|nr:hypothetical protein [Chloroflexota bacterium]
MFGRLVASRSGFRWALLLCGMGISSYGLAALRIPPGADLTRHVGWFMVSFACYLPAVVLILGAERRSRPTSAMDMVIIAAVAVLMRLLLLATVPSLSDDVLRYVWDGKVLNAGIDPYRYPPAAAELAQLRSPLWEGINHKSMSTPYPPLAEGLFALVYRLSPENLIGMQIMAVAFDLGVVALLVPMLAGFGLDVRRVLIYAWNPLVALQFAHSGHFDAAMILTLLGAIFLLSTGRRAASGALLGLSILVKLVPAMMGPLFLPFWGIVGTLAAGAVTVAGLLPWLGNGTALSGILLEASDARFNDSLSYLLVKALGVLLPNPESAARGIASLSVALVSVALGFLLWRERAEWKRLLRSAYWLLGLTLMLNAVVEPWYLTWMLPFVCFAARSNRHGLPSLSPAIGWLLLSGTIVLTDLTYASGAPGSTWVWVRAVEYLPLCGLLLLEAFRWVRRPPHRAR